jgi:hypothetical protein
VHADSLASESARAVNAHAYTVGDKLVFGAGRYAPQTQDGRRLIAHELAHVAQQSRFPKSTALMRAPADKPPVPAKPPVPKPGQTPFNFISESPALENWKAAAKGVLEREFKTTFGTFEEAQEHFRKHLQGLPSDSAREDFGDRMRDRVRKAFYRSEGRNPSYAYKPEDIDRLKNGSAPESGLQLEHMEDVKSKQRAGTLIKGRPERAVDPGNVYVTEGGPGGTAPKGTKHAEKYRTIEEAKRTSREIRDKAPQTVVAEKPTQPETASPKPPPVEARAPSAKSPPVAAPPALKAVPPETVPPVETPIPATAVPRASPWKAGLKAGAGAAAWMAVFMALGYFVHKKLQESLEKEIEVYRPQMQKWAAYEKKRFPDRPVYMQLIVESEEYSRFIPLVGWMPEPPVLHVTSVGTTATPVDPPDVKVDDHSMNILRPGKTVTVTYTELLIP